MKKHKQTIIHIHGAGPKHYRSLADGSGDWQAHLSEDLGPNYRVLSPEMPSPRHPEYEEWKVLFEKYLAKVKTSEVILVGHSLGGSFLLKYLSHHTLEFKIAGLFIVAAPFNNMPGFEAPQDYSALTKISPLYLYHSIDDVEVPYAHALMYRDRLQATLRSFSDQGHFFKRKKFVEIIHDIQKIGFADAEPMSELPTSF